MRHTVMLFIMAAKSSKIRSMVKAETQDKQLADIDPTTIKQRLSAYGVLIRDGGVLMVKTHSDKWELPGGTPEPGETLIQGLERELTEETALHASTGRLFYMRESFYHSPSGKSYHSLQFYFLIDTEDSPSAADSQEYAFLRLDQLNEQTINNSAYKALQHITENTMTYDLWDH